MQKTLGTAVLGSQKHQMEFPSKLLIFQSTVALYIYNTIKSIPSIIIQMINGDIVDRTAKGFKFDWNSSSFYGVLLSFVLIHLNITSLAIFRSLFTNINSSGIQLTTRVIIHLEWKTSKISVIRQIYYNSS